MKGSTVWAIALRLNSEKDKSDLDREGILKPKGKLALMIIHLQDLSSPLYPGSIAERHINEKGLEMPSLVPNDTKTKST